MNDSAGVAVVHRVVRIVLGVARLGEVDLKGWWHCHGLDEVGGFVLRRALPRTWRSVALELDVLSAQRRHEDALSARKSALHLFSDELPLRRWAAAWLSEQKTADGVDDLLMELSDWDNDSAAKRLREWTGEPVPGEVLGGGLRMGQVPMPSVEDIRSLNATARRLGAAYLLLDRTFQAPYLDVME